MCNYNYKSRSRGKKKPKTIPIRATEEMLSLVQTTRIELNEEKDTVYIYNGSEKPIQGPIAGDPLELAKQSTTVLKPKVVQLFRVPDDVAARWIGLLNDEILNIIKNPEAETEEEEKKSRFIHKYSTGVPLLEAVTIGDQPCFVQMKNEGKLDINILPEYDIGDIVLKPRSKNNYLCEPIVFKSKEEVLYYLELAKKLTDGKLNFDKIFQLVKTISKKYEVLDHHHIILLVADTIYSYFQDKFATTHYVMLVGDNSSGKNSILLNFEALGYHVLMGTSYSGPNIIRALGPGEAGQITIAEDEIESMDDDPNKKNIVKSGYTLRGSRIPKIDLNNSADTQQFYSAFCFKMFASEKSLDELKSRGFLDRTFVIQCLAGRPKYNIKKVYEETAASQYLRDEIQKTRKLLFACRMLYHGTVIENIGLNLSR